MTVHVHIRVMPRPGLLDPQGQAVERALTTLGFAGIAAMRVGRAIEFELEAENVVAAEAAARGMCERLLANPVTEDFTVTVES